jgi:hypothetical protein
MITGKKRKSSKYIFTLTNVNTEKVDQLYGIKLTSNITINHEQPNNTTNLTELCDNTIDKTLQTISFLDESKKIYKCKVSMIDFRSGNEIVSNKYNCYWCRHKFSSIPIGCPIEYISNNIVKNYHSEVSKDNYVIRQNMTKSKYNFFMKKSFTFTSIKEKTCNLTVDNENYYMCDGIFCSFNCAKAFIIENKHNRLYELSNMLLTKLYTDITCLKDININPAPSWRLLEEYGGDLNINQFRENFNKVTYEYHGIIKNPIVFKAIGSLYEEKINF